ncbi:MAG TPA: diaminopimelate decarboxylase [Lachnospiraceae bacterium]|nr:diaminopimelate decarboxylase [Lachnospiraceae bacterium]
MSNNTKVTDSFNFFNGNDPKELVKKYGSPLYVISESIIRQRCRELKNLVKYPKFIPNYSAKANSNLAFLEIVQSEGLNADAMSPGEIHVELMAGFKPEQIFYVSNNVSADEMKFAVEKGVTVSVDSLSQLETYGKVNKGGKVAVRLNPGVGAGHSAKVVTGGKKTKFGFTLDLIPQIEETIKKYDLKLIGINQHIGSLYMEPDAFLQSVATTLEVSKQFKELEFIDFGGGFGIPYQKLNDQPRLDLKKLGEEFDKLLNKFVKEYGKEITFKIEPGRYISAESSVLLGTVTAVKTNGEDKYIGTDIGFNVLQRPVMYDSHHDIEVYNDSKEDEKVTVVGNICESGDILAKDRVIPKAVEGDIIGVLDAGAYGYSMCSNYNNRLRPAEVLIRENGEAVLVRERDTFEDLTRHFISIKE